MSKKSSKISTAVPAPKKSQNNWLYLNFALAAVLILAGVALLFWAGQSEVRGQMPTPRPSIKQGQPAPNFTLTSLEGQTVNLSDYAGQVVMVNMWATWCPPCKAEMPDIHQYYQAHQADGFVVLAVNSQEDASTVKTFIDATGFTFPVLVDLGGTVMNLYNVRGLPTSVIVDRDGTIKYTHTGQISPDQLEQYISPLL
jgi:peroxiredoxin